MALKQRTLKVKLDFYPIRETYVTRLSLLNLIRQDMGSLERGIGKVTFCSVRKVSNSFGCARLRESVRGVVTV